MCFYHIPPTTDVASGVTMATPPHAPGGQCDLPVSFCFTLGQEGWWVWHIQGHILSIFPLQPLIAGVACSPSRRYSETAGGKSSLCFIIQNKKNSKFSTISFHCGPQSVTKSPKLPLLLKKVAHPWCRSNSLSTGIPSFVTWT